MILFFQVHFNTSLIDMLIQYIFIKCLLYIHNKRDWLYKNNIFPVSPSLLSYSTAWQRMPSMYTRNQQRSACMSTIQIAENHSPAFLLEVNASTLASSAPHSTSTPFAFIFLCENNQKGPNSIPSIAVLCIWPFEYPKTSLSTQVWLGVESRLHCSALYQFIDPKAIVEVLLVVGVLPLENWKKIKTWNMEA